MDDCCCDVETVDSLNRDRIYPLITSLTKRSFFRFFPVRTRERVVPYQSPIPERAVPYQSPIPERGRSHTRVLYQREGGPIPESYTRERAVPYQSPIPERGRSHTRVLYQREGGPIPESYTRESAVPYQSPIPERGRSHTRVLYQREGGPIYGLAPDSTYRKCWRAEPEHRTYDDYLS